MFTSLTAAEILAVPAFDASRVLPGDEDAIRSRFRDLARDWHPDRCHEREAPEVFAHLVRLRDAALGGPKAAVRCFLGKAGKSFEMSYLKASRFDAGEVLVGRGSVAYLVETDFADLAATPDATAAPRFANDSMRKEMERFLPSLLRREAVSEGEILVYARTPDQVLLRDLLESVGPIEPVHAAWLTSGLLNVACWLSWTGLCHGAISPDVVLVSPKHHSVALTGPALYATAIGGRPVALPERTLSTLPRLALAGQAVDATVDLDLVRATVREALGDPAGVRISLRKDVPTAFATWLAMPPSKDARQDYASWERARESSFGPRRFVGMGVRPEAVYG